MVDTYEENLLKTTKYQHISYLFLLILALVELGQKRYTGMCSHDGEKRIGSKKWSISFSLCKVQVGCADIMLGEDK